MHDGFNHRRKYTEVWYHVHLEEVAQIIESIGGDEDMIIAAAAHDLLEDITPLKPDTYNKEWLVKTFGERVAQMVDDLTDKYTKEKFPKWNRAKRKEMETQRWAMMPKDSQTIKLADLINNSESIVKYDSNFAKTYLREKYNLLKVLTKGDKSLHDKAKGLLEENCLKLGIDLEPIF